jgi:hypothetical protein
MTDITPQIAYEHLNLLEQVDAATSALYRQLAQEILADGNVNLNIRQAIADRLNQANRILGRRTAGDNDSY